MIQGQTAKETYTSRNLLNKQMGKSQSKTQYTEQKTNASSKNMKNLSNEKKKINESSHSKMETIQSKKELGVTSSIFSSIGFNKKSIEGPGTQTQFYNPQNNNADLLPLGNTISSQFKFLKKPSILSRQSSILLGKDGDSPTQTSEVSMISQSNQNLWRNQKKHRSSMLHGRQRDQQSQINEMTENFKEMVKSQSQNFIFSNKALVKEKKLQKTDLETLIIQKNLRSDLDVYKREYYEFIEEQRRKALRNFRIKNKYECLSHMKELISIAQHAFDLDLLKKVFNLRALIHIFFDDYSEAIKDFKQLRTIAEEDESYDDKMQAYENMGRCYQMLKQYDNAIKCHKKQLELAWRIGDTQNEIRSYEAMGIQYYYTGELEKSKFYNDRFMRGKFEKKDSQIRKIYEVRGKEKMQAKNNDRIPFKKVKLILESFDQITNKVARAVQKRIFSNTYGTGKLQNELDFFKNGVEQKERGLILRLGSPISEISVNDLPSPRIVIENNKMKNACLLPHYDQNDNSALTKKQINFLKVAKNKGFDNQLEQSKNETAIALKNMNREKLKDNTTLEQFRKQREESKNIKAHVDMAEVLRKAKLLGQSKKGAIQINHLSPNRNLRHFKEQEDLRQIKASQNFDVIEHDLKEQILFTENDAVNINNLTEDHVRKILSPEKLNMVSKKLIDIGRRSSLRRMYPYQNSSAGINKTMENTNNGKSMQEIQILAQIKFPGVFKIKKYNEIINNYVKQNVQNLTSFKRESNGSSEVGSPHLSTQKVYSKFRNFISKNSLTNSRKQTSQTNLLTPKSPLI